MQDEDVRRGIGARLKECRLALKLSQPDVAGKVGRTPQAVSKWELGKSAPSAEDWFRLGTLFGVSLDYLVYGVRTVPVSESAFMTRIFAVPGIQPTGATFGTPERLPAS